MDSEQNPANLLIPNIRHISQIHWFMQIIDLDMNNLIVCKQMMYSLTNDSAQSLVLTSSTDFASFLDFAYH